MRKKIWTVLVVLALLILGNLVACVGTAAMDVVRAENEKVEVIEEWETV